MWIYLGGDCILGDVGDNFAAGMTGGMAFIFDINNKIQDIISSQIIVWNSQYPMEKYLKNLVNEHKKYTICIYKKDNW